MKRLIIIALTLVCVSMTSQVRYDSVKNQKYVLVDVHSTYERIILKGYISIIMLEYLGNYHFKDMNYEKSKSYYDMLFKHYDRRLISEKSIKQYNICILHLCK